MIGKKVRQKGGESPSAGGAAGRTLTKERDGSPADLRGEKTKFSVQMNSEENRVARRRSLTTPKVIWGPADGKVRGGIKAGPFDARGVARRELTWRVK